MPIKKYEKKDDAAGQETGHDAHQDAHQDTHQDKIEKLRIFCKTPRSRTEMQELIGLKDKVNFKKNYIVPMLEKGIIEMTIPDKPTSRNQKYIAVENAKEQTPRSGV